MNKDKIEMEYEARVMINEAIYYKVIDSLTDNHIIDSKNDNIYFDTSSLLLTKSSMVLRKRIKNDIPELTLKIKGKDGDEEITNHNVSFSNDLINEITPLMKKRLLPVINDLNKLLVISYLRTWRKEIFFVDYTLVIDKNEYNNKTDYNLEVESKNKSLAKTYLDEYITKFNIDNSKEYISKSRRAIFKL